MSWFFEHPKHMLDMMAKKIITFYSQKVHLKSYTGFNWFLVLSNPVDGKIDML